MLSKRDDRLDQDLGIHAGKLQCYLKQSASGVQGGTVTGEKPQGSRVRQSFRARRAHTSPESRWPTGCGYAYDGR